MKEKDTLATQTDEQRDPSLAKPEDFEILRDGDQIFTGQRSDRIQRASDSECSRKKYAGTPERPNADKAAKPHTP